MFLYHHSLPDAFVVAQQLHGSVGRPTGRRFVEMCSRLRGRTQVFKMRANIFPCEQWDPFQVSRSLDLFQADPRGIESVPVERDVGMGIAKQLEHRSPLRIAVLLEGAA